jgi:hypothetical protein
MACLIDLKLREVGIFVGPPFCGTQLPLIALYWSICPSDGGVDEMRTLRSACTVFPFKVPMTSPVASESVPDPVTVPPASPGPAVMLVTNEERPLSKAAFKLGTSAVEATCSGGPLVASAMKFGPVVRVPSNAPERVAAGGPCAEITSVTIVTNAPRRF